MKISLHHMSLNTLASLYLDLLLKASTASCPAYKGMLRKIRAHVRKSRLLTAQEWEDSIATAKKNRV